jgi:alpha-L-rhamnosidase
LWDYYWQTGDASLVEEFEDPVRRILGYFQRQTSAIHGLIAYDPRYWLFLDWADVFREGYSGILTLWVILALEKIEVLAQAHGCEEKWKDLSAWRSQLVEGVRGLIAKDGLMRDGRTWDGVPAASASIHAQTLAITAGVAPECAEAMLSQSLLPFIRGEMPRKKWPSVYWMAYVFRTLIRHGFGAEVAQFIRGPWRIVADDGSFVECESGWQQMARHGSTWSQFGGYGGRQSHSHAWSAHPLFQIAATLGGITQTAPA